MAQNGQQGVQPFALSLDWSADVPADYRNSLIAQQGYAEFPPPVPIPLTAQPAQNPNAEQETKQLKATLSTLLKSQKEWMKNPALAYRLPQLELDIEDIRNKLTDLKPNAQAKLDSAQKGLERKLVRLRQVETEIAGLEGQIKVLITERMSLSRDAANLRQRIAQHSAEKEAQQAIALGMTPQQPVQALQNMLSMSAAMDPQQTLQVMQQAMTQLAAQQQQLQTQQQAAASVQHQGIQLQAVATPQQAAGPGEDVATSDPYSAALPAHTVVPPPPPRPSKFLKDKSPKWAALAGVRKSTSKTRKARFKVESDDSSGQEAASAPETPTCHAKQMTDVILLDA